MKKRNRQLRGSKWHINDCYNRSSEAVRQAGSVWYVNAHYNAIEIGELAGYGGDVALKVGSGIISALSPKTDWDKNLLYAKELVRTGYAPRQTEINNTKALRILEGEEPLDVLGGLKVIPFYLAIRSPEGDDPIPVIDRHAAHVYTGYPLTEKQQKKLGNVRVVTRIQNQYLYIARKQKVHVHRLQATTWLQTRIEKGYATL